MKILDFNDHNIASFQDFSKKNIGRSVNIIQGKSLYRYENCLLSGNLIKDKNGVFQLKAHVTRPDLPGRRWPLINNFIDNNNYKEINIGLIFNTLRDTNFAFFVSSCLSFFWYYKKIRELFPNEKISIITVGTRGGGMYFGTDIAALLQTKFMNESSENWYEICKCNQKKQKIKNKIKEWLQKNNYSNFSRFNKRPEKVDVVYNINYIQEILELLFLNENIEIVPQNNDLSIKYLFIGEKIMYPFLPDLLSETSKYIELSNTYKQLIDNANIKINKNKNSNIRFFYLSRRDSMDRRAFKNKTFISLNKIESMIKNLDLEFNFVNASHYTTVEKYELFANGKLFIVEESAAFYNCIFFPENSIIIVILHGKWKNAYRWWKLWSKSCLSFLNHTVLYYDSKIEPDFNKFVNNITK